MSEFAGPSRAAGGEGPGDSGGNGRDDKSNRAKKVTSNPRQSAATQLQLKVMRKCLERLSEERVELTDIEAGLKQALAELEGEIVDVTRLKEIAEAASNFQHGLPFKDIQIVKAIEGASNGSGKTPADRVATAMSAANWEVIKQLLNENALDNSDDDLFDDEEQAFDSLMRSENAAQDLLHQIQAISEIKSEPAPSQYFTDADFD